MAKNTSLWANSADKQFDDTFLIFLGKQDLTLGDNLHEMSPVCEENKKTYFKMLPAEIFIGC